MTLREKMDLARATIGYWRRGEISRVDAIEKLLELGYSRVHANELLR